MRGLILFSVLIVSTLAQDVLVTLPDLGTIQGRTKETFGNLGVPKKTYYNFRNIPFAESVSLDKRFSQPVQLKSVIGTQEQPYDATRSGPLCPQLGLDEATLGQLTEAVVNDLIDNLLTDLELTGLISTESVITLLEDMFEVPVGGLTVAEIINNLLDVDFSVAEDCLHLAVSTPYLPGRDAERAELLPVMFFIYGGGFRAGTQMKMGYERLGDVNDVVLVAINYRLGPLGFMCLDTESSAGNMGLLDQIVGLEWVRDNIEYFGGDPNQITIFGESAGAASVSLLALSPSAQGLFHKAIGQSASAASPWAFDDKYHEYYARQVAAKVGCVEQDLDSLVECMKIVPYSEIMVADSEFGLEDEATGTLGFGGVNGCGQTKGARKVFSKGEDPVRILESGTYNHIPMMWGANDDEGLLAYSQAVLYVINSTMQQDEYFLRYQVIDYLLSVAQVNNGYAFSELIQEAYFKEDELGDFTKMSRGFVDLLGVATLKASSYKMIEENSRFADSYFYALEMRDRKSFHRIFNQIGHPDLPVPGEENGLAAHADDLLYLFDVPLPLVLCNLKDFFNALAAAYVKCVTEVGLAEAEKCVTDHDGEFKANWGECVDGHLSDNQLVVSDAMVKAWTNFAISGNPTPPGSGLPTLNPWRRDAPEYIVFDYPVEVRSDYRKSYSKPRVNVH